jgi:hypothetical protein
MKIFVFASCVCMGMAAAVGKHVADKRFLEAAEQMKADEAHYASLALCNILDRKRDKYAEYNTKVFMSGCMWEKRTHYRKQAQTRDQYDWVDRQFNGGGKMSPEMLAFEKHCAAGAHWYQAETKVDQKMLYEIYFETLHCDKVFQEDFARRTEEDHD